MPIYVPNTKMDIALLESDDWTHFSVRKEHTIVQNE